MAIPLSKEIHSPSGLVLAPPAAILARLAAALGRHRLALRRWRDRTAAVRQLTRLDERMLKDIGLERHELAPLVEAWQVSGEQEPRWPQRWSD
jgi:uncharacterized protein YjiS (DUF1127 family)